jgi:hypothetical protein
VYPPSGAGIAPNRVGTTFALLYAYQHSVGRPPGPAPINAGVGAGVPRPDTRAGSGVTNRLVLIAFALAEA